MGAICDLIVGIIGLPFSIFYLIVRLSVLACGFYGALYRKRCCILIFLISKFIMFVMEIASVVVGILFIGVIMGFVSFEYFDYYINEQSFTISVFVGTVACVFIVIYAIIYIGLNLYTMFLSYKISKVLKKLEKRRNNSAEEGLVGKELEDFSKY